ncbi:MAG: carboxypeptidase M32 [Halobacteria archaeon]
MSDSYDTLLDRMEKITNVGEAEAVLRWDQEVMMPEDGTPARSRQLSTLSSISHDMLTADETRDLIETVDTENLDDPQKSAYREMERDYRRAAEVPNELVEEISRKSSDALPKWKKAKETDEFEEFAPILEEMIELKKDYAREIDPDRPAYEVLFEDYEPYLSIEKTEKILEQLGDHLNPLIDEINSSNGVNSDTFDGEFPKEKQRELVKEVLDSLGYDWSRGRLDTGPHPFSTGNQFDSRIVTRFEDNPMDALTSTVHEFGHSLYTLGLPKSEYGNPLGESRDLSVHESQSRLWENHVGRSRPFLEFLLPKFNDKFDCDIGIQEAYESLNHVHVDNPIRVEADELTYHMHIVLRFEIEKMLIEDELDVEEVPQVWNSRMEEYLDVLPNGDDEGCLQDIHWSHGSFGYFPTYSLGSVMAAQMFDAMESDIEVDENVKKGEFAPLRNWLEENVHRYGCRYRTDELVEKATGEELTVEPFLDYVDDKYRSLYGI